MLVSPEQVGHSAVVGNTLLGREVQYRRAPWDSFLSYSQDRLSPLFAFVSVGAAGVAFQVCSNDRLDSGHA